MGKSGKHRSSTNCVSPKETRDRVEMLKNVATLAEKDYQTALVGLFRYIQTIRQTHGVKLVDVENANNTPKLDHPPSEEGWWELSSLESKAQDDYFSLFTEEMRQSFPLLTEEVRKLGWDYNMRELAFKRQLQGAGAKIPWEKATDNVERECDAYSKELKGASLKIDTLKKEKRLLDQQCDAYSAKLQKFRATLQNSRSIAERYRGKVIKVSASVTELEDTSAKLASERSKLDKRATTVADEFEEVAEQIKQSREEGQKEIERRKRLEKLWKGFTTEREALRSEIEDMKDNWKTLEEEIGAIASEALGDCYVAKDDS